MKRVLFLFCSTAALVCCSLLSCSKTDSEVQAIEELESEDVQLTEEEALALHCNFNGPAVAKDEVIKEASKIAEYLDENSDVALKSKSRKIAAMTPVTGLVSATKSTTKDTLAFVVSFGEGLGFAVLSADIRADPVLLICPEGDLVDDGESGAPSVDLFYQGIKSLISEQIQIAEAKQDSLLAIALAKIEQNGTDSTFTDTKASATQMRTEYYYGVWYDGLRADPLVKVTWGQDDPYYNDTPIVDGKHCVTGCVATAIAQIVSYYKWPDGYNWSELTKYSTPRSYTAKTEVARLMRDIGDGVSMNYGVETSSANDRHARKYFIRNGYDVGDMEDYSYDRIRQAVGNNWPVYVGGYRDCLFGIDWLFPSGGHAWVIDGLLTRERKVTVRVFGGTTPTKAASARKGKNSSSVVEYLYTESQKFVHCNWGWNSYRNGWYADGVFDTYRGPASMNPVVNTYDNPVNSGYNFKYKLECLEVRH